MGVLCQAGGALPGLWTLLLVIIAYQNGVVLPRSKSKSSSAAAGRRDHAFPHRRQQPRRQRIPIKGRRRSTPSCYRWTFRRPSHTRVMSAYSSLRRVPWCGGCRFRRPRRKIRFRSMFLPAALPAGDYTLLVQGLGPGPRRPGQPEGRRSGALPVCLEPEPLIIVGTPIPPNASRGPS